MTVYGYARVSIDGQTLDAQVSALKAAGAQKIFSEKQSGAKTDRAALSRALEVRQLVLAASVVVIVCAVTIVIVIFIETWERR